MTLDIYIVKEGQELRCGYTTGSCAAAAAKAAAIILELRKPIKYVEIDTPANIRLRLEIKKCLIEENKVTCSIVKDAGDDPDSTNGIEIFATVSKRDDKKINIEGGKGIGRITRKGLFGDIGDPAINPIPLKMIKKEVQEVSDNGYDVLIFTPEGEEISKKTFNKNIGIQGGISIIGTKGIVYPMSEEAILKTIYMEVDIIGQNYGRDNIVLVPGNYGEKIAEEIGIRKSRVKISNFIGDSLLYVYNQGFNSITLLGHIGKFAKLSIGIFNTHSKVSDGRMEAFVYYLALMDAPTDLINMVNKAITAEEGLKICIEHGYGNIVKKMEKGAEARIRTYLKDENYKVKVMIYSMEMGIDIC